MLIRAFIFSQCNIMPPLRSFLKQATGATAIEYGLIAGGISLVIIVAVFAIGGDLKSMFTFIHSKMSSAAGSAASP